MLQIKEGSLSSVEKIKEIFTRRNIKALPDNELWEEHKNLIDLCYGFTEFNIPTHGYSLLDVKIELVKRILKKCNICRNCNVNRLRGEIGLCGIGIRPEYYIEMIDYGGDMDIFPSHSVYLVGACPWESAAISGAIADSVPRWVLSRDFIKVMEKRKNEGARFLQFTGGSPEPHIFGVLRLLKSKPVGQKVVWNTTLYYSVQIADIIAGVADIILADFQFGNNICGEHIAGLPAYFTLARKNLLKAKDFSSIMIRHQVQPGHLMCCTLPIVRWINQNLPEAKVNIILKPNPMFKTKYFGGNTMSLTEIKRTRKILTGYPLKNVVIS